MSKKVKNNLHMACGKYFTAAAQLGLNRVDGKKLVSQPGYRRGENMVLAHTDDMGIRLFVSVSNKWMDGSLQSMVD